MAEERMTDAQRLKIVTGERDRALEREQARYKWCICSAGYDGKGPWITPPSCPMHGIKHLRDTNAERRAPISDPIHREYPAVQRLQGIARSVLVSGERE